MSIGNGKIIYGGPDKMLVLKIINSAIGGTVFLTRKTSFSNAYSENYYKLYYIILHHKLSFLQ
jgi:hypothetical protein